MVWMAQWIPKGVKTGFSLELSHDRSVRLSGWDRTWAGTCPPIGMGAFLIGSQ